MMDEKALEIAWSMYRAGPHSFDRFRAALKDFASAPPAPEVAGLVERLRELSGPRYPDDICGKKLMAQAADLITAQAEKIAELERERDQLYAWKDRAHKMDNEKTARLVDAEARVKELERERDAARAVLIAAGYRNVETITDVEEGAEIGGMAAAITVAVVEAKEAAEARVKELEAALKACLNYIENTEAELGITLISGDAARAALAGGQAPPAETSDA